MAPGLGDMLGRLFGSGGRGPAGAEAAQEVEYNECVIRPAPRKEGGQWLTAGTIVKTFADGVVKEHRFVRADTHGSRDAAVEFSIIKAKQMIDFQGDALFDKPSDPGAG